MKKRHGRGKRGRKREKERGGQRSGGGVLKPAMIRLLGMSHSSLLT